MVRPGLFVFAPAQKSAAADVERRPTRGTTRRRNQLRKTTVSLNGNDDYDAAFINDRDAELIRASGS
jgi:hypothetical protein